MFSVAAMAAPGEPRSENFAATQLNNVLDTNALPGTGTGYQYGTRVPGTRVRVPDTGTVSSAKSLVASCYLVPVLGIHTGTYIDCEQYLCFSVLMLRRTSAATYSNECTTGARLARGGWSACGRNNETVGLAPGKS